MNPSNGTVSSTALTTNYYYDHRGELIAKSAPGGLWTKSVYDGAGRDVFDYTTDGAGGTTWKAAGSVSNDTVLEQMQTVYDSDSNPIESIASQRFHNDTATQLGPLGSPTSGIGARVYYTASYYDNADRLIASVNVGTNGGTAWTRPSTVPSSSATLLVTNYAYNAAGWVQDVTDPQGIDNRTLYDNLGRVTKTIQDYTGGMPGTENDITTEYGYDGNNNTTFVQADEPGGSYQKTAYVYGVTTAGGSGVNSNDLLSAVQHPNPSTGNPSSSQQDTYLVNALGQVIQSTDRNGNVHQYTYDVLGRLTSDAVTTLGTGVDGTVRRITYAYDSQGNNYLITSYNAASGGSIVNQVQRVYNGLGQLTGEYQSHSGAVVVGSTPEVQYAYTEMSGGQNNSRLVSMTYPSGYVLNYNYNTGLDSNISRLSSISDASNTLESYKYLGLDTVVERDHPQNNVNLTYIKQGSDPNANGDGGDQYTGLDRFGRVIDQNWYNATSGTSTDRFQYGYNQDSDVLYRQNLVDAVMSELYNYDNLNQLTSFQRGTLNSTHNGIVGSPSRSQSWTPDALGNFTGVNTNSSTQTRTANQQNEYTTISGQGNPTYDANGNLTADGTGNTYVYDAWNRLVAVKNGSTTLASYGYDGLDRRITETHGTTTTDLYYSSSWQLLEEDVGGVIQARNVWSPARVDTLVLRDQSSQHNGTLDQRLYVQEDANGNVTALVDTSGNVVERYAYDPYGAVNVLAPDFSARGTSSYGWLYFFQGKRYDGTVGLYDSRERVYSPTLMRPLQADPLGLGPDSNDYRWERDGPTDATDPSGEIIPLVIGGVVLAGIGIGALYYSAWRYDNATQTYLGKPAVQWTPAVQAEYRDYVTTTQWIAAGGRVAAVTGIAMVATPVLAYGGGYLWAVGPSGKVVVVTTSLLGLGGAGYEGYSIRRDWDQMNWPTRVQRIGCLAGPMLVGGMYGPRYFRLGLQAGRPTYNLGGIGEVPGAINVQPPGALLPPAPRVITPSNQLPFPPGSGNVIVNSSPISPQAGGMTGPYGPLGPPYMPEQIAAIASGGGKITITQGVGTSGTLTTGQQSVINAVPSGSLIGVVPSGEYTTTVYIVTPLSYPAWIASHSPMTWGGFSGYASTSSDSDTP